MEPHSLGTGQDIAPKASVLTKFFNAIDFVDRALYGKKMAWLVGLSFAVVILAPFIDNLRNDYRDRLTFYSTLALLVFLFFVVSAWIGSWRDDEDNWTWARARCRLQTLLQSFQGVYKETATSQSEMLWSAGKWLVLGGLAVKAVQNVSVLVRKPLEGLFSMRIGFLRDYEKFSKSYYWYAVGLGVAIIVYLYYTNPKILLRVKAELLALFGLGGRNEDKSLWENAGRSELVISAKSDDHIKTATASSKSLLFNDFLAALNSWHPGRCRNEYEFQDKLAAHLKRSMPQSLVQTEYPVGDASARNRGRADIVIDRTILVEMKRSTRADAIQRAKGQMMQYTEVWQGKGPVILLLCDFEFEHARITFNPIMIDLQKLERSAMTIVATN